ncbi:FkbM family methyltransferase [Wocania ichthyoenteri]|uniref:FkbM family methyltransferase n=1 Tax=Wocania ichthyoenteri TaxID=1230531 RepID=UPI00053F0FB0|nr:FkbM family methyltransferase [Wocania ichthyoenteri]
MNIQSNNIIQLQHHKTLFSLYDPDQSVHNETFSDNGYEPGLRTLIEHLVTSESLTGILDIGSLYGYFPSFIHAINPDFKVYAFEPGAQNFDILKQNKELGNFNATLFPYALSDENCDLPFHNRTTNVTIDQSTEIIKAFTYDTFRKEHKIKAEIAKIDVHGSEALVLNGMKEALAQEIRHVFIEIHALHLCSKKYSYKDIIDILHDAGFLIFEMKKFRYTYEVELVHLSGANLEQFIDYDLWSEEEVSKERMLYAIKK